MGKSPFRHLAALSIAFIAVLSSCSVGEEGRLIALRGDWQIFPGRFLYPVDFEQGPQPLGAISAASLTAAAQCSRTTRPPADPHTAPAATRPTRPQGRCTRLTPRTPPRRYGTLHASLSGFPPAQGHGVIVPAIGSAYTMWVNGVRVAQVGRVATTEAEEIPEERSSLAILPRVGSVADIVVQLSAFHGDRQFGNRDFSQHDLWFPAPLLRREPGTVLAPRSRPWKSAR